MEENAHCPFPEKLSSLALCLSMNSLCARRGPGQPSRVQRDRAVPSRAVTGPNVTGLVRPGECSGEGLSGKTQCLLVNQSSVSLLLRLQHTVYIYIY